MRRREQIHARESRCLLLLVNKFTHLTVTPSLPPSLPPSSQPMRFGNKAFRDWHARLLATAAAAVEGVLVASGVREMREMREGGRKGGKEGGREGRREGVAGHGGSSGGGSAGGVGGKEGREGGREGGREDMCPTPSACRQPSFRASTHLHLSPSLTPSLPPSLSSEICRWCPRHSGSSC